MKRITRQFAPLALAVSLLGLGVTAPAPAAAGQAGSFRLEIDPPPGGITATGNPDSAKRLTEVTVVALGPDGDPLEDAVIDVALTAPTFNSLERSDIPRIEGRPLLHTRFLAPQGAYTFKYAWPIRGDYRVELRAEPAPGSDASFTPFADARSLPVGERSGEAARFVIYLVILFAFGAVSSFVLLRAHRTRAGETPPGAPTRRAGAPLRMRLSAAGVLGAGLGVLILGLMAFLVTQQLDDSRADREAASYQGAGKGERGEARDGPVKLRYQLSRSNEDGIGVQTLLTISGSVEEAGSGRPLPGAGVRLEAVDLESGEVVFATEAITPDGRFAWDHDFWDGIEYDVRLTAMPGRSGQRFEPVSDSLVVEVAPMSPPLSTKLVGMAYSLGAFLAGISIVLLINRRRLTGAPRSVAGRRRLDPQGTSA